MICVDVLMPCIPNKNWKYSQSCHLFSSNDNLHELHEFAKKLGLRKAWFQNSPSLPHYDLTANKRLQAIKNGATQVSHKYLVEIIRERRRNNLNQEENNQ